MKTCRETTAVTAWNCISHSFQAASIEKTARCMYKPTFGLSTLLKTELYFIILSYLQSSKIQGMGKILKLSSIIVQKFLLTYWV